MASRCGRSHVTASTQLAHIHAIYPSRCTLEHRYLGLLVCLLSNLHRLHPGQLDALGILGPHPGHFTPHFGSFRLLSSSSSGVVCVRQKGGLECSSIGGSRGYRPRLYGARIYVGLKEPSVVDYGDSFHCYRYRFQIYAHILFIHPPHFAIA